ncbi:hypothetical protein [Methylophaga sp.]|uniref:hypothetical protein n=1 Tax=Methylophaga sp. TaxID=2024840 RepID=UPI003A8DB645
MNTTVVPNEPTMEMLKSAVAREQVDATHYGRIADTYRTMVKAAPDHQFSWPVVNEIQLERVRQIVEEGFTRQHDDRYDPGVIAGAAAAYAMHAADALHPQSQGDAFRNGEIPDGWCWDKKWFKPTTPRQSLIKAAALIVAEIEKLDRQA